MRRQVGGWDGSSAGQVARVARRGWLATRGHRRCRLDGRANVTRGHVGFLDLGWIAGHVWVVEQTC